MPDRSASQSARHKKRLYFGHPISLYDDPLEVELVAEIKRRFPDWEIVNPNSPEHQAGYVAYEKTRKDEDGKPTGMGYFFECVLPTCDGGVHLAFRDGMFGKGVFGEAEWQQLHGFPTWEILPDGTISELPAPIDPARCLSREETWTRLTEQSYEGLSTEKVMYKPY